MKLSHIIEGEQPEAFDAYVNRLIDKLGVKKLGSGLNSQVFEHPTLPNVAVKVFMDSDIGYREYIDWCINHPANKRCPKVLDDEEFSLSRKSKYITPLELHTNWNGPQLENPPYSIVFLERLEPAPANLFDQMTRELLEFVGNEKATSLPMLGVAGWKLIAAKYSETDMRELAGFFVEQLEKGHKLDIGRRRNFMLRGSSEIVFVDPFY